jgi:hypothetical protein
MLAPYLGERIDLVVGRESREFIWTQVNPCGTFSLQENRHLGLPEATR